MNMNIVLLSGGSGKRLWPLSNDIRSKQFIKIFRTGDGEYESMVQRVYRQIRSVDRDAAVTIATSKTQVSAIHNQLGNGQGFVLSHAGGILSRLLLLLRHGSMTLRRYQRMNRW